jgi:outer membrane protein OmpA-like peptidoglycan-associated protein
VLDDILKSSVVAEGLKVGIYGHTDNTGNDAANQQLSEARAASVKAYLIAKGLVESRLESKGFGSAQPIADNNSTTGKAQNRRVQIVLGQ